MTNSEAVNPEGGASFKGRKATRLMVSSREIKMLRPVCKTCEDEAGGRRFLPVGWWNDCPHDPYVSYVEKSETVPIYEDQADGSKKLVGTETVVRMEPRPNWASITQAKGMNSGKGPQKALSQGFIFPQQLRSPIWPNGIKRRCQFRECYEENGLKKYDSGWFCRKEEAKLVKASDKSTVIEIGGFTNESTEKRNKQIEDIQVEVLA